MGLASVGFALAGGFWTLFAARLLQGAGQRVHVGGRVRAGCSPPRRATGAAQLIGSAMGAAIFGALFGPVIGAAAALAGRDVDLLRARRARGRARRRGRCGSTAAPPGEQPSAAALVRAFRDRQFAGGLALMALPSLLFGVLSVLGPLHLSNAGWGAAAIGGVWLVGAALEAVQAPLIGRLIDRARPAAAGARLARGGRGARRSGSRPTRGRSSTCRSIVLAAMSYGVLFTPAFALIADGAEHVGLAQGMAFGFMNAAWAVGAVIGPAAGGAIAGATGDWIPFVLAAALCASALAVARRSAHERAAVLVDRLPGDAARVGRE